MRRLWHFHSAVTVNLVLPHSWCRLISRKGDQVRDSEPVALSDQTWRGRLGAFSAETLYLTKFQLLAGLWGAELAPRVRKNRINGKRHQGWLVQLCNGATAAGRTMKTSKTSAWIFMQIRF